ncbi:MAG: hypothetical protein AAGH41_11480 [Pseudomonadota bacterium]
MLNIRSFVVSSVLPAVLMVGAGYQLLMGLNGPDGARAAERLAAEKTERMLALHELSEERARLEARADRLLLSSLDEDLLEERVRANLGHMKPGEYRIPASDLDRVAAVQVSSSQELTSLIAVALLDNAGV